MRKFSQKIQILNFLSIKLVALSLSHIFFKKWNFDFFHRKIIFFCWFFSPKTNFHVVWYISSVCAKFEAKKNFKYHIFERILDFSSKMWKKNMAKFKQFSWEIFYHDHIFSDFSRYLWCFILQGKLWSYMMGIYWSQENCLN